LLGHNKLNLKDYQAKVAKLAKEKGYNQELFYLHSRMIQESSEMLDAIWQGKSDDEVAEEGADVLHFFFQIMQMRPKADIDDALLKKIASNYIHKKKTNDKGSMIKK
jgi:NTP pyrophosphatase (non-canonical NTP hydrolase)